MLLHSLLNMLALAA